MFTSIKNLFVCLMSCFLFLSSTVVSVSANGNSNEPYSGFNAMLIRLFNGNETNIIVNKNGADITDQFINNYSYLYETDQLDIIVDVVADNQIIFSEPSIIEPLGFRNSVYRSDYMYGIATGTSEFSGAEIKLPFIYHIVITASYNDATGKISGTPRVSVEARPNGGVDEIKITEIDHFTLIINDGYSVQCTRVSFVPQAYGSLNEWGIWQTYDRFTWTGLIQFTPAG